MAENQQSKGRILYVEDMPLLLMAGTGIFRKEGYDVVAFQHPDEALKLGKDEHFNVVLLDGLEGRCFEIYNATNAERKIIYSGHPDINKKAEELGMEHYVKRPGIKFFMQMINAKTLEERKALQRPPIVF